ncbi:hypothetical protein [Phenylobacterium sp.]|uniref:hypothetical protein n=1 Tax=Phenylobacterium sp. TaxID=1871053 RepID=UPI002FE056C6
MSTSAEIAERHSRILSELAELGLSLARSLHERAVAAEDAKSFLARTEDRVATPSRASAEACEPVALKERPTTDPKGVQKGVDTDCDGEVDTIMGVPDSKRHPITIWVDDDGDGKLDTMYFDDRHDGVLDSALYDTDGNGRPDMRGEFRNGEDEPYRWERIRED